ncbi:MAG: hypothetical protein C4536_12925 [Actinobacteria bacterium]|jgi:hypothetical protein|nr:MAG: hypothetical protein C4536_12925 [Actinomycetota bacterium]
MESRVEGKKHPHPLAWQVKSSYIENLITVGVDAIIMGGIYFALIGSAFNHRTLAVQGYILMFVPLLSALAPVVTLVSARNAYVRGKWEMAPGEPAYHDRGGHREQPGNPWFRIAPVGLAAGFAMAGLLLLVLWFSGADHIAPIWVILIACGAAMLTSTSLLGWRLKRDLAVFAAAVSSQASGNPPPSIASYYVKGYALPWSIVALIIAFSIGLKGVKEEALKAASGTGVTDIWTLAASAALTFLVLAAWTFYESQLQVRPDMRLTPALLDARKKPLGIYAICWLLVIVSLGAGLAAGLPFWLAGAEGASVAQAQLADVLISLAAVLAGSFFGMQRGRRAEARRMAGNREQAADAVD